VTTEQRHVLEGGEEAAPVGGGRPRHVGGRGSVLATGGEALDESGHDQDHRCPETDRLAGIITTTKEQADIKVTLKVRPARRPRRSAYRPKNHEPTGRLSAVGARMG